MKPSKVYFELPELLISVDIMGQQLTVKNCILGDTCMAGCPLYILSLLSLLLYLLQKLLTGLSFLLFSPSSNLSSN